MNTEEKLQDLIKAKYGTMYAFAKSIDMPNSTLATIMRAGVNKASISSIIKICHALNISVDELAKGNIVNIQNTEKDPLIDELPALLEYLGKHRADYADLSVDGQALSPSEWRVFLNGMAFTVEMIRKGRIKE